MGYADLEVTVREPVAVVTVRRPEVLNALRTATLRELGQAFGELSKDPRVRAIILTGAGEKAFSAGADIREFLELDAEGMWRMMKLGQDLFDRIADFPKAVIGAVNGYALGGGLELALACDILIASENARFGHPEINIGSFPGWGGTQRLPRRIGLNRAKELIFTGMKIDARRAEAIGLVNRVVPPGELMSEALALATEIAGKSAPVIELAKTVLNAGAETSLREGQNLEACAVSLGSVFADRQEGVRAFVEKRKPRFNRGNAGTQEAGPPGTPGDAR